MISPDSGNPDISSVYLQYLCIHSSYILNVLNFRAQILVCDILPRAQSGFKENQVEETVLKDINTEVSTVNYAIRLIANLLPWLDYVEFPSFLQNHVIERHMLSRDGLHLSFKATKYVAETITKVISKYLNGCHDTTEQTTYINETLCYDATEVTEDKYSPDETLCNDVHESSSSLDEADCFDGNEADPSLEETLSYNDSEGSANLYNVGAYDREYSPNISKTLCDDNTEDSEDDPSHDKTLPCDDSEANPSRQEILLQRDSEVELNLNNILYQETGQCHRGINSSEIRLIGGGNGFPEINAGDKFASFHEFKTKFDLWCEVHGFPMRIGGSEKLANSTPSHPYKSVRYQCKHAGKPRLRGNAKRPVQQYLASGCEAVIRVHLDSSGKEYVISKVTREHNHIISTNNLGLYASNRKLNKDDIEEIKPFLEMKVPIKEIKNYLSTKTGKQVITKDILNAKRKVNSEIINGRTQGEILSDLLNELNKKDPNATTILQSDENNDFDLLFFQTSEMKQMFAKFPGMIFIDNTYNVCSEGYILNSILAEDSDGSGKPVAYCFMRRETKETVEKVIDMFCEHNDTSKVNVIMVDKDLTEISVLEDTLSHARIQICTFHVLKYFKTKVAKLNLNQDEKSELVQLLREILYSDDEEKYNERHNRLHEQFGCFSQYFDDNWHSCRDKWVRCYQKNVKNYGNFTNNKIESHNEKIKKYVSRNMHLPEALQHLLKSVKDSYDRSAYSNFLNLKTRIDTSSKDETRNRYAIFCVQPAFDIIRSELNKVESIKYHVEKVDSCMEVTSVSDNRKHSVDEQFSSCSCSIWSNYILPCRHIFVCRKSKSIDMYDESLVDPKWKKSVVLNDSLPSAYVACSPRSVQLKTTKKSQNKMTSVEKFLKASEFLKEFASFLSTCGETDFYDKLDYLKHLKEQWMQNESVLLPRELVNEENNQETFVHTIVVETGPDVSNSLQEMNGQQDIISTTVQLNDSQEETVSAVSPETQIKSNNFGTEMSPKTELFQEKIDDSNYTEQLKQNTECNDVDNDCDKLHSLSCKTSNEPFHPVNIPTVKSRIGRPKGTNKPFWEFSKSKRPLSLKKLKRKCEDSGTTEKRQRTENDLVELRLENDVITIEAVNEPGSEKDNRNSWIKTDSVSLEVDSKALIEGGVICLMTG